MECVLHKQGPLITQVPKFGRVKNTAENVIFGRLGVYYTNYVHCILLLGLKTFQDFIKRLLLETMTLYLRLIHSSSRN